VTKSHYPYPPDEFDTRGTEGAPVGVHREPRSGWSTVWPFLLVAVVFAGIAVGVVSFLSDDSNPSGSTPTATATQAGEAGEEGEEASEEPSAEGEAEGEGEATEEPPAEEGGTMPGDPAEANLEAEIVVYNDEAGAGEAGNALTVLEDAGFTAVLADDATNAPSPLAGVYSDSTVLYGVDRADTASAVAEALGVSASNVQESEDVASHPTNAVWVVLKTPVG
jgi:hypothetical protein